MNSIEENFLLNGYVKFDNQSNESYTRFYDLIMEQLGEYSSDLESIHKKINPEVINDIRINIFNKLNAIDGWEKYLYELGGSIIDKIIGTEISIQNKLNFSIQLPGDKLSQVPMHTDRAGGHSLFECVLWMSFTNSKATSSMYIVDYDTTLSILEELPEYEISGIDLLESKYSSKFKFIDVKPGECILFSSNLYHGNVVNVEETSRISINCRIKSLWAPEFKKYPNERVTGAFYKPYKFSPISIFGSRFINKEPKFE